MFLDHPRIERYDNLRLPRRGQRRMPCPLYRRPSTSQRSNLATRAYPIAKRNHGNSDSQSYIVKWIT